MSYDVTLDRPVYRSVELDDVQGWNDLALLWTAIREVGQGKRKPFRPDVQKKIVKGLKRTMHEAVTARTRGLAASIVLAMLDEDWTRNVKRGISTPHSKVARARAASGKGPERLGEHP